MIKLLYNNTEVPISDWNYPAGEVGIRVPEPEKSIDIVNIVCAMNDSDDIMKLLMTNDALRHVNLLDHASKVLTIGYMAYGRQDRVATKGDPHAVRVMAKLIGSMDFDLVRLVDPHSKVTVEQFTTNCRSVVVEPNCYIGQKFKSQFDIFEPNCNLVQVFPDAGSYGKYSIGDYTNHDVEYGRQRIMIDKIRNPVNGKLGGFKIDETFSLTDSTGNPKFVIIDDICDGGGTFIGIASLLRETYGNDIEIYLFVTHGIFSQGTEQLTKAFTGIYTTNSFHYDRVGLIDGVNYVKLI